MSVLLCRIYEVPLSSRFIVHLFESARGQLHDLGSCSLLPIGQLFRPKHNTLCWASAEQSMSAPHTVSESHLLLLFHWAGRFLFERFQCFVVAHFANLIELVQVLSVLMTNSIRLFNCLVNSIKWHFCCVQAIRRLDCDSIVVCEHVGIEGLLLGLPVMPQLQLEVGNMRQVQLRKTSDLFVNRNGWPASSFLHLVTSLLSSVRADALFRLWLRLIHF